MSANLLPSRASIRYPCESTRADIDYTAMPPDLLKNWQARVDQLLRQ